METIALREVTNEQTQKSGILRKHGGRVSETSRMSTNTNADVENTAEVGDLFTHLYAEDKNLNSTNDNDYATSINSPDSEGFAHISSPEARRPQRESRLTFSGDLNEVLGIGGSPTNSISNLLDSIEPENTTKCSTSVSTPDRNTRWSDTHANTTAVSSNTCISPASPETAELDVSIASTGPSHRTKLQTPMRSCLSDIKQIRKRNRVVFGSPKAAEFDSSKPVTTMTPMPREAVFNSFRNSDESESSTSETDETTINSSILADWDQVASPSTNLSASKRRRQSVGPASNDKNTEMNTQQSTEFDIDAFRRDLEQSPLEPSPSSTIASINSRSKQCSTPTEGGESTEVISASGTPQQKLSTGRKQPSHESISPVSMDLQQLVDEEHTGTWDVEISFKGTPTHSMSTSQIRALAKSKNSKDHDVETMNESEISIKSTDDHNSEPTKTLEDLHQLLDEYDEDNLNDSASAETVQDQTRMSSETSAEASPEQRLSPTEENSAPSPCSSTGDAELNQMRVDEERMLMSFGVTPQKRTVKRADSNHSNALEVTTYEEGQNKKDTNDVCMVVKAFHAASAKKDLVHMLLLTGVDWTNFKPHEQTSVTELHQLNSPSQTQQPENLAAAVHRGISVNGLESLLVQEWDTELQRHLFYKYRISPEYKLLKWVIDELQQTCKTMSIDISDREDVLLRSYSGLLAEMTDVQSHEGLERIHSKAHEYIDKSNQVATAEWRTWHGKVRAALLQKLQAGAENLSSTNKHQEEATNEIRCVQKELKDAVEAQRKKAEEFHEMENATQKLQSTLSEVDTLRKQIEERKQRLKQATQSSKLLRDEVTRMKSRIREEEDTIRKLELKASSWKNVSTEQATADALKARNNLQALQMVTGVDVLSDLATTSYRNFARIHGPLSKNLLIFADFSNDSRLVNNLRPELHIQRNKSILSPQEFVACLLTDHIVSIKDSLRNDTNQIPVRVISEVAMACTHAQALVRTLQSVARAYEVHLVSKHEHKHRICVDITARKQRRKAQVELNLHTDSGSTSIQNMFECAEVRFKQVIGSFDVGTLDTIAQGLGRDYSFLSRLLDATMRVLTQ